MQQEMFAQARARSLTSADGAAAMAATYAAMVNPAAQTGDGRQTGASAEANASMGP